MRSFDERKAEIFSRSKQRIAKRKKIIFSCLPIFLCIALVSVLALPQMRPKGSKDEMNKNMSADKFDTSESATHKGVQLQPTTDKAIADEDTEQKKVTTTTEKTTQPTTQTTIHKPTAPVVPTTSLPQLLSVNLMRGINEYNVLPKQTDNAFIESQMRFSVDLFKASAAKSKNENMLISPLSVQLALSMTANGADGKTREEMEKVLGGGISIEDMNKYLKFYADSLPSGGFAKLKIANSIWFRDAGDLTIEKDFLRTNATYYNAGAFKSPFNKQTVEDMNEWVSDNTNGLIDNIVEEINPSDMMYLVNTIMFDAEWDDSYADSKVKPGTFTSVSGKARQVNMMRSDEYYYLDDGSAVGFIKRYYKKRYSFATLLPNEGININDYISGMTWESLLSTLHNSQRADVDAEMPKFKYEYDVKMKDVLADLGMPTAFSTHADFSKTTKSTQLYIDNVNHKTFIDVNQTGTTAAAATHISKKSKGGVYSEPDYTVTLDRPFVYMIIDNNTKTPIFIGAVMDIGE